MTPHLLADVGSTIDNGPFAVFIALAVTALLFTWIGATFNRNQPARHKCVQCGEPTDVCGSMCRDCDRLAAEPLTPEERAAGVAILEAHLARWRGES